LLLLLLLRRRRRQRRRNALHTAAAAVLMDKTHQEVLLPICIITLLPPAECYYLSTRAL